MGDIEVLLHNDCNRMLKRPSRINLVNEVMYKLFKIGKPKNDIREDSPNFLEILLYICGCNKSLD